jgi:thymidylate synthase (FAD)
MAILHKPNVTLIAYTEFKKPTGLPWETDSELPAEQLIEMAGRACYLSWSNPAGRSNAQYIRNMLDHGHLSVIEHASATFYVTGVSRSLTHELIRHRHLSFSQQSQRYVPETAANFIEPDVIAEDPELHAIFEESVASAQSAYHCLLNRLEERYADVEDRTLRRKLARQAARSVMPNATETRIVVTGNYRAWRHFIRMRASEHADVEIRCLAVEILRQLTQLAPSVFGDFEIYRLADGDEAARTTLPHG